MIFVPVGIALLSANLVLALAAERRVLRTYEEVSVIPILLWLQAATLSCNPTQPAPGVTVIVQAVDPLWLPLPGASITITDRERRTEPFRATTDRHGFACLTLPAKREFSMVAELVGFYEERLETIEVYGHPGAPQHVQLRLRVMAIR